ncbi:MAG: hypothetical protein Q4F00_08645 [bacterium]|nr:hypothetical protein [bacterium]
MLDHLTPNLYNFFMDSFINYAQFEDFWQRLEPLTPYGKDLKQKRTVYSEEAELVKLWESSDRAAQLLQPPAANLSRIRYFLKRLPRFRSESLPCYDEADIFEYKKFLSNYRRLLELLPAEQRSFFALDYSSHDLEQLLSCGDQYADTFYVADAYSEQLAQIRAQIRAIDKRLADARRSQLEQIALQWGWDITGEYLLVSQSSVLEAQKHQPQLLEKLVVIEPFDGERYAVRPHQSGSFLALQEQRQNLAHSERREEQNVLENISEAIRAELPKLCRSRTNIGAFDMALARARLAQQYDLQRPQLNARLSEPIVIEKGRFIPCQEQCERLNTVYIPLDWQLSQPNAVLFGSNMGGKTIALKTLAFLQLCVQTGLYVPAQTLRTCLFRNFRYIGEGRLDTPQQGLSGFGYEVSQFCEAYSHLAEPTLLLFDEFARTTNSREAEAFISAILADIAARPTVRAVFSSHFHGIARLPQVGFFKMRGVNRAALDSAPDSSSGQFPSGYKCSESLQQRLQQISSLIDYRIQPDPETLDSSDALTIAALLGVPPSITEQARQQLIASSQKSGYFGP